MESDDNKNCRKIGANNCSIFNSSVVVHLKIDC